MTLEERCKLATDCLPRAEYRRRLEALHAELLAMCKDAQRLDHIESTARCDPKMDGQNVWWPTSFNHRLTGPTLRAAIDAAMTKETP